MNWRFQFHEFTISISWIHNYNSTNLTREFMISKSRFQLHKVESWIHEVEIVCWNLKFVNSVFWKLEFMKLKLRISEVLIVNSWSWNILTCFPYLMVAILLFLKQCGFKKNIQANILIVFIQRFLHIFVNKRFVLFRILISACHDYKCNS
jgi:hypothetical protein